MGCVKLVIRSASSGGKREAKSAEVRKEFLIKVAEQASKAISVEMPVVICGPGYSCNLKPISRQLEQDRS